ncbi:MAG: peptide chain release factor N(5)-glutamine methyltransferase [Thermomicrobiales bacterium]
MTAHHATLHDLLRVATSTLTDAGIDTARLDAEVLLRSILNTDRTGLFMRLPDPIPDEIRAPYDALIARRIAGEPVAYLVGMREFMGMPFAVNASVLVPRPETELLVEWAMEWLSRHPDAAIVDVGTGSGAIAISLAAAISPSSKSVVVASDASAEALAVMLRNRQIHAGDGIVDRIVAVQQSLLNATTGEIDLILANLPYLTPAQIAENPDLAAEPRMALDGGADGLDLVRALIADLPRVLTSTGAAGFELDPSQTDAVEACLRAAFPGAHVRTIRDLAGLPRHVVMERDAGAPDS